MQCTNAVASIIASCVTCLLPTPTGFCLRSVRFSFVNSSKKIYDKMNKRRCVWDYKQSKYFFWDTKNYAAAADILITLNAQILHMNFRCLYVTCIL